MIFKVVWRVFGGCLKCVWKNKIGVWNPSAPPLAEIISHFFQILKKNSVSVALERECCFCHSMQRGCQSWVKIHSSNFLPIHRGLPTIAFEFLSIFCWQCSLFTYADDRKNQARCKLCFATCWIDNSCPRQGQTGRVFQLRVGSGLGIEKIFWVGSGWVSGICIKYQVNWVLWGIEILIGYSPSISLISYTF